jgi:hypothetical protein
MSRTVIRLRAVDQSTLKLEIPQPDGSTTVITPAADDVRAMYHGLSEELSGIFARFEDPRHGETSADFPYPTPVNKLSARVPRKILAALDEAETQTREGGSPVLLLAEGDPFPWEVIRPRPDTRMLGQTFDVARFDGECAEQTVEVPGLFVIAPSPTDDEGQCDVHGGLFRDQYLAVKEHFPSERTILLDCTQATRAEVLAQLGRDDQRIIHYMGHHYFNAENPAQSWVQLANSERLSPQDIADELGGAPVGLKWPWTFLNCCKSGSAERARNSFGEAGTRWGPVLHKAGSHMTIGPYWRVDKIESVRLARDFYQHVLGDGWTIGAAMREIRSNPRPSTRMAYTLFGDPTLRVRVTG